MNIVKIPRVNFGSILYKTTNMIKNKMKVFMYINSYVFDFTNKKQVKNGQCQTIQISKTSKSDSQRLGGKIGKT